MDLDKSCRAIEEQYDEEKRLERLAAGSPVLEDELQSEDDCYVPGTFGSNPYVPREPEDPDEPQEEEEVNLPAAPELVDEPFGGDNPEVVVNQRDQLQDDPAPGVKAIMNSIKRGNTFVPTSPNDRPPVQTLFSRDENVGGRGK